MRARWIGWLSLAALATGAGAAIPPGAPPLPGKLAYIRYGVVCVMPAAGGRELFVPGSKDATALSLSPDGKTVLFFVPRQDQKPFEDEYAPEVTRGFVSRAPFARSEPLPAPLDLAVFPQVGWTASGDRAFIRAERPGDTDGDGEFVLRNGKLTRLHRFQGVYRSLDGGYRSEAYPAESLSHDGRVTAWTTEWHRVDVRSSAAGPPATLISSGRPERMIAALRRARYPSRIRPMLKITHESRQELSNWVMSPPALTPDGKKLFFASNAGDGTGATGGTNYCFFAADLQTKQLAVLSRLGMYDTCRIPDFCRVSPDGERLLFNYQTHGSVIENPNHVVVVDLRTQQSRELINRDPVHRKDINFTEGPPCWSPDGRYVAVSVCYYQLVDDPNYDAPAIRRWIPGKGRDRTMSMDDWDIGNDNFQIYVYEAATGRRVRAIPHAILPSWSR